MTNEHQRVSDGDGEGATGTDFGLSNFPLRTRERVRYADTDRQGHVNNAVFATFLETGRVELLYDPEAPLSDRDSSFVIARLVIEFHGELKWPGEILIGTRVLSVGRSSIRLEQAIFQHERRVATGESVIVQMDDKTRRARALSEHAVRRLASLQSGAAGAG